MKSDPARLAQVRDSCVASADAIRRVAKPDFVDWLEEHFYLSAVSSGTEGLMKLYFWQRGLSYAMAHPLITYFFEQKPIQMGASKRGTAYILYSASVLRRNGVVYQPTTDDANDYSATQFAQAIEHCPEARQHLRVVDIDKKDKDNTAKRRVWRGAITYIRHANTEATFRRITVDDVWVDDYDAMGFVSGSTVQVKSLGRSDASIRPKQIVTTSPGKAEESNIVTLRRSVDEVFDLEIPCPSCEQFQEPALAPLTDPKNMELDEQKWTYGLRYKTDTEGTNLKKSRTCYYQCKHCDHQFGYEDFPEAESKSRWISDSYSQSNVDGKFYARNDFKGEEIDPPDMVFYRYNGLLKRARFKDERDNVWQQLMLLFLDARDDLKAGDDAAMVGLVTEKLGIEYYSQRADEYPLGELVRRLEEYDATTELPAQVQHITFTVDYQGTYADWMFVGWGSKQECWILDTGVIPGNCGNPNDPMYTELDLQSDRTFKKASGETIVAAIELHDGGYRPREIEEHCRKRIRTRIVAKGDSTDPRHRQVSLPQNPDRQANCFIAKLGVHQLATRLYGMLDINEPGPGYIHAPRVEHKFFNVDPKTGEIKSDFWAQFTADRPVYKLYRKKKRVFYECPEGRRNEKHDLFRMALAAIDILIHRKGRPLVDDYIPPVSTAVAQPSAVGNSDLDALAAMVNG